MSVITDVVVVAMYGEDAAIEQVNKRLAADVSFRGQQLAALDMSAAGGDKAISACVYAASFNYGDIPSLRGYLADAPWHIKRNVMICIDGELDSERVFLEDLTS